VEPSGLSRSTLTRLLRTIDSHAEVAGFSILGGQSFGDGESKVSTAGRAEVEVQCAGRPAARMVIKLCRPDVALQPLYRNEVAFYRQVRPDLDLEIPAVFGADFDEESGTFGLIMEDLRDRGAIFPNVTTAVTLTQVHSLLDLLARLHAHFWCHGDCHIGNTYLLPGDRGGLLDWQLTARGSWAHDISYLIITALSVADRRNRERQLIRYYLDRLARYGVAQVPAEEEAWYEYRLAANWCLYIGWLTTPKTHYGWEITACNVIRLSAAVADLGSVSLAADLP